MLSLKRILKSKFVRNVFVVASGTVFAQVIALILTPVITRLYGPEAYGLMGAFVAVTNILGPIAALTLPIAIVISKTHEHAKKVTKLSILLSGLFSVILLILLLIFKDDFLEIFQLESVGSFIFLIPFTVFFAGVAQICDQWILRLKEFGIKAKTTILHTGIVEGGKAGVGIIYPKGIVLVIFSSLRYMIKSFIILLSFKKIKVTQKINTEYNEKDLKSLKKILLYHKDFLLYRAPQTFLFSVSQSFPILFLSTVFGASSVGFFTLSRTVLSAPTILIGKSVADVFYPKANEVMRRGGNLKNLLIKSFAGLAAIGLIPFGIIFLFGPFIFSFVFGSDWAVAGEYAMWISFMSYFMFITRPVIAIIPVLNLQKQLLIYEIFTNIFRISALLISYLVYQNSIFSIACYSIVSAILYLLLTLYTITKSNYKNNYNN